MSDFSFDPRLEDDSIPVADLPLCAVRLMRDANYPWVLMIPRQAGLVEIIDLAPEDRLQLMEEIATVSAALKQVTGCDKLNVGALGNMVPQLHVHVIARFKGDAAWPGPVWGVKPATAYEDGTAEELIVALRARLGQPA